MSPPPFDALFDRIGALIPLLGVLALLSLPLLAFELTIWPFVVCLAGLLIGVLTLAVLSVLEAWWPQNRSQR